MSPLDKLKGLKGKRVAKPLAPDSASPQQPAPPAGPTAVPCEVYSAHEPALATYGASVPPLAPVHPLPTSGSSALTSTAPDSSNPDPFDAYSQPLSGNVYSSVVNYPAPSYSSSRPKANVEVANLANRPTGADPLRPSAPASGYPHPSGNLYPRPTGYLQNPTSPSAPPPPPPSSSHPQQASSFPYSHQSPPPPPGAPSTSAAIPSAYTQAPSCPYSHQPPRPPPEGPSPSASSPSAYAQAPSFPYSHNSSPPPLGIASENPSVPRANRPSGKPISITYRIRGGKSKTETFDYLIVACDPRNLRITDRTSVEQKVVDSLVSYTFRTSLFRARRPDHPQLSIDDDDARGPRTSSPNYAVRFNPGEMLKMDGSLYGFRDEVFAHDKNLKPDVTGTTYCTTYQLEGRPLFGRDSSVVERDLDAKRDAVICGDDKKENIWVDWKPDTSRLPQPEEKALVDYFPHFGKDDLKGGMPWIVRDAQGEKNTFYVSSFTCFESVLHCYLYGEMLMDPDGPVMRDGKFPTDKSKSFAVVGAGPSGLLFASQHLKKKGFENFKIFESTERFGGKCLTYRRTAPGDGSTVPCELGTCYLSPAYQPIFHLFEEYGAGKIVSLDRDSSKFRSIVDAKVAETVGEREDGVEYNAWISRAMGRKALIPDALEPLLNKAKIAVQGAKYSIIHYAVMGITMNECMPEKMPNKSRALANIRTLIADARARETGSSVTHKIPRFKRKGDQVRIEDLYGALCAKNEESKLGEENASPTKPQTRTPRGIFSPLEDIGSVLTKALAAVESAAREKGEDISGFASFADEDLEEACGDVFDMTFEAFLEKNEMMALYPLFVYAYSIQGYGSLPSIEAYMGLVWITPASLLKDVRDLFSPPEPGSTEDRIGTVNIVTTGWLSLFEKIVETDLHGKIVFNVDIQGVNRLRLDPKCSGPKERFK